MSIYLGKANFRQNTYIDFDLTGLLESGCSYLLSINHDGYNNHNFLYLLSSFIGNGYPFCKLIGQIETGINLEITSPSKNIIRISAGRTMNYTPYISLFKISRIE